MNTTVHPLELFGLDGSNPLAFLATLGVLRCLNLENDLSQVQLSWTESLRPVIHASAALPPASLCERLEKTIKSLADKVASLGDILGVPVKDFRSFARPFEGTFRDPIDPVRLAFAAAFASDAVVDAKKGMVVPTALSFSNGQGGKLLLKDFRTLASRLTAGRLSHALFEAWRYDDRDEPTFRWDPLDMRTGAHMATDPGSTQTRSVMAANALAFVGLSFLPVAPGPRSLLTTGFRPVPKDGELCFTWPLWRHPISGDVVISLLQSNSWSEWNEARGVMVRFASHKINFKKNLYLGGSFAF